MSNQSVEKMNSILIKDNNSSIRDVSVSIKLPLNKKNKKTLDQMIEYVKWSQDKEKNPGLTPTAVGIAAPQVGNNICMFYVNFKYYKDVELKHIEYAMINPKIIEHSRKLGFLKKGEGCLSVINQKDGYIPRSYKIIVTGYDYLTKSNIKLELSGYEAIVFQHEQMHLKGKLYYDLINKKNPWKTKDNWLMINPKYTETTEEDNL